MSLQDLIIKEESVTEELIEKIVVPYCKYTETGRIIFNEHFIQLSFKQQILVYLVAKSGLPFVTGNPATDISADNLELQKVLNIKGDTLRARISELRRSEEHTSELQSR